jgi:P-type Cu+ transporter
MQKKLTGHFRITGMTCAACVNSVEGILTKLPGVKRAVIALATSQGEVEYDPTVISKDEIVNSIEDAGFDASFLQSNEQDKALLHVTGLCSPVDAQLLDGMIANLKGVKQVDVNLTLSEVEVVFDPEAVRLRDLVDGIERESSGRFQFRVQNPYIRAASSDAQESSKMLRHLISSLLLTVSSIFFYQDKKHWWWFLYLIMLFDYPSFFVSFPVVYLL